MRLGTRFWRVTAFGCLAATILGFCYAAHTHFLGEDGKPVLWTWALADYMGFWWGWGLLSGANASLVHRFPIGPKRKRNVLYHVAAAAVASPLHSTFCYLALRCAGNRWGHPLHWEGSISLGKFVLFTYPRGMVYYFLIVAIIHALNYYRQYEERAVAASQLEAQLSQAKLHLLKMQLHPHFLFNTLNSISALLHEDVEQADLMIERMGDFLRLTLDRSTAQEITLREEMEFVNCYLAIEQIRLQERLAVRTQIDNHALDARVPSLILQPIVENAIRHGIAPRPSPGRIEIEARRLPSALLLTVRDDGPGLAEGRNPLNGRGMGLKITRDRLERLYGQAHRMEIVNSPQGGLLVTVEIPFASSISAWAQASSAP